MAHTHGRHSGNRRRPPLTDRPTRLRRYRRRGTANLRFLTLVGVFLVLVGVNLYVFFFRGGTSIGDLLEASSIRGRALSPVPSDRPTTAPTGEADTEPPPADTLVVQGSMKGHLGLSSALTAVHLEAAQVQEVVGALEGTLDMRSLRPEQRFEMRLDPVDRSVEEFTYHLSRRKSVELARGAEGELIAREIERPLTTEVVDLGGEIESSLAQAIVGGGGSSALVSSFTQLFAWDINWYNDPRPGDTYRIIAERRHLDGKFFGYGRVLAAEYAGEVGQYRVYYHLKADGSGGYYTEKGRSIRRSFLRVPLNFRRVSSQFNLKRFHPILHRTKGHYGVDYAAARGTPVWAAGDGVVVSARNAGGAGNMVILRHAGGIVTLYMHLNRFARGLRAGLRVTQGETIGFVGSTGLATGPHLHYGVKVGGRYIDPLKFEIPPGARLVPSELERFEKTVEELKDRLEEI